jgi:hypothetical protein
LCYGLLFTVLVGRFVDAFVIESRSIPGATSAKTCLLAIILLLTISACGSSIMMVFIIIDSPCRLRGFVADARFLAIVLVVAGAVHLVVVGTTAITAGLFLVITLFLGS